MRNESFLLVVQTNNELGPTGERPNNPKRRHRSAGRKTLQLVQLYFSQIIAKISILETFV